MLTLHDGSVEERLVDPRLAVLLTNYRRRRKKFIDVSNRLFRSRLFDEDTTQLEVINRSRLNCSLERSSLGASTGAGLLQQRSKLICDARFERLSASDQSERSGEGRNHEMCRFANAVDVDLRGEIFSYQLLSRLARDRDRTLDDRNNDFSNTLRQSHR